MRPRRARSIARALIACIGMPAVAATGAALQFGLQITNAYGVFTEIGDTTVTVYLVPTFPGPVFGGGHFRCGIAYQVHTGLIWVAGIVDAGEPAVVPVTCERAISADVGPLAPGQYQITAQLTLPDGSLTEVDSSVTINARGNKCNADPTSNELFLVLANKTVLEFQDALANDAAYRTLLGDIAFVATYSADTGVVIAAFPPLDDPLRLFDRLQQSGEFKSIGRNLKFCFTTPPGDSVGTAIEYYNTTLGHYFFTADTKEQQAIDAGAVGSTWVRTGKSFPVTLLPGCPVASETGTHLVYRFAGEADIGPNSHFFTVSLDECAVVRDRKEWHWSFEGAPFWASEPVAGACPAGKQPLYRAFNNGIGGDPNHRYATDNTIIDAMVAQDWVDEGARMCVPASP